MGGSSRYQTRTAVCSSDGLRGRCDGVMSHGACVYAVLSFFRENSAQMLRTLERMPCFISQLLQNSTNVLALKQTGADDKGVNFWCWKVGSRKTFKLFNARKRGNVVQDCPPLILEVQEM